MKLILYTLACVLAFAANSLLCRMALEGGAIDAISFTWIRLTAGALVLSFFARTKPPWFELKSYLPGMALWAYALLFSLAYRHISAAAGALLLFGSVQLSLFVLAKINREPMRIHEMAGMVLAALGLVYWLWPHWGTPSAKGFLLMVMAGVAWGVYTWMGKHNDKPPVAFTAWNFSLAAALSFATLPLLSYVPDLSSEGAALAVVSGAVTSALAYALWYHVLPQLNTATSANVQLTVPLWAALMGWLVLGESVSSALWLAAVLIFSGVMLGQKR